MMSRDSPVLSLWSGRPWNILSYFSRFACLFLRRRFVGLVAVEVPNRAGRFFSVGLRTGTTESDTGLAAVAPRPAQASSRSRSTTGILCSDLGVLARFLCVGSGERVRFDRARAWSCTTRSARLGFGLEPRLRACGLVEVGPFFDVLSLSVGFFDGAPPVGPGVGFSARRDLRNAPRGGALGNATRGLPGPVIELGVAIGVGTLSSSGAKVTTGDLRRVIVDQMSTK